MRRSCAIAVSALIALVGCDGPPDVNGGERRVGYEVLDERAEPLRGVFNADAGKVRVVILASPT